MKVLSVEEMKAVEKFADSHGVDYDRMMQNAGRGITEWLLNHVSLRSGIVGLVGAGNNGGDTLIALTLLSKRGVRTNAFLVRQREDDSLVQDYLASGGAITDLSQGHGLDVLQSALIHSSVLLDGILGTGLRLPIREELSKIMTRTSNLVKNRSKVLKIAVDCPSGVDCDTGEVSEAAVQADHTLCMAAIKQGLLKFPARSFCGALHTIDIGISEITAHLVSDCPEMIDASYIRENNPSRPDMGHKGTFGTCLVVAGSKAYTGAAFLAGEAAYRAGCGLVHVGTTQQVYQNLAGKLIEAVWTVLPTREEGYSFEGVTTLTKAILSADSLVIGPGWGLHAENLEFLIGLLKVVPKNLPILIDADGLKLLSQIDRWWACLPEDVVLTPHPGEMAILSGLCIQEIQASRWDVAKEFAQKWQVILVLKGAPTVIATPEGQVIIHPICDSALATAGSGDVLSGIIGGLLAQDVHALPAAVLGVWRHASAGLTASERRMDQASVTAKDILDAVTSGVI